MWQARATLVATCELLIVVGFSWCRAWALEHIFQQLQYMGSVVAASRLWNTGSTVVVQGFSCSKACGVFPDQGSNSCPSHWQVDSLPLSCQGSPIYTLEGSWDWGLATHSSISARRIPWTEEPGGLQSIKSQRVGHDWSNLAQGWDYTIHSFVAALITYYIINFSSIINKLLAIII